MADGDYQDHIEGMYQHLIIIEAEVDILHRYLRLLGGKEIINAKETNQEECNQETA